MVKTAFTEGWGGINCAFQQVLASSYASGSVYMNCLTDFNSKKIP